MINYDGEVKRIDLNFRAQYPLYSTKIFKLDDYNYQILIKQNVPDFTNLSQIFDREIRFATVPVKLVETPPLEYTAVLDNFLDHNIANNFEGLPLTGNDIVDYIESRVPESSVHGLTSDHSNHTTIICLNDTPSDEINLKINTELKKINYPYTFKLIYTKDNIDPIDKSANHVFRIQSASSKKKIDPGFWQRDEELWINSTEDIYNNNFKKEDLYFYDPNKTSCLVDFSILNNSNIRNHLLLYDTIYCIPPFLSEMPNLLNNQKLDKNDLLYLVETGRLKFISTQPEERLDLKFLSAAYERNADSVITRRAVAALTAIDLVNLNSKYLFADEELTHEVMDFIASQGNEQLLNIGKALLWPKSMLRRSFDILNSSGPKGIPSIGICSVILNGLDKELKDKIQLEMLSCSEQVHISHALNATYFPYFDDTTKFSLHPHANLQGFALNLYDMLSIDNLHNSFEHNDTLATNNPSIDLISIFDVDTYIPIKIFNEITLELQREDLVSLFSELQKLQPEQLKVKISDYNAKVENLLSTQNTSRHLLDLGVDVGGLFVPFLGTMLKSADWGLKRIGRKQQIQKYLSKRLASSNIEKRRVSLLAKINRVARLRKYYA